MSLSVAPAPASAPGLSSRLPAGISAAAEAGAARRRTAASAAGTMRMPHPLKTDRAFPLDLDRAAFVILGGVYSLKTFRIVALAEATSFLLLLVASVLKRTADADVLVTILGPIHGILFIAYVLIALAVRPDQGWDARTTLLILLGAVVPFGGYVVDRWLARREPSPVV